MQKTLILSDLHLTNAGELIIGLDPMARLRRVLDHALEHHGNAERLVLLGDLTHHGTTAQYARLKSVLETCPIPVVLTVGNHDTRAGMAEVMGAQHLNDGFAQQVWHHGDTLFLLIDTVDEDDRVPRHAGWLCEARLDWVREQIASSAPKQIVALMHHPPVLTGFAGMDNIRLINGNALLDLFVAAGVPVHLICGHIHRTISGLARGFPFSTLKSPCHQMPMALGDTTSGLSVDEPGAYGILLTDDDTVILHSEDVFEHANAVGSDAHSE